MKDLGGGKLQQEMFAQFDFYLLVILICNFLKGKHSLEKYDMGIFFPPF